MNRPRIIAAAALSAVTVTVLTGCAGGSNGESVSKSADDGPVSITFSSWLRGSQDVVDAFNESHDDVQVTFQEVASGPDNYPQLTSQVEAGNAPDVVTVEYPRVAEMASQGVLADITDVAGDLVSSDFPESVQSLVNFGGSTWSVPFDAGVFEFYYRADLFDEYGIKVPTTWDEYKAAAEAVKEKNPDARIGATVVGDPALYAALAWQAGAQWGSLEEDAWGADIDSAETRDAMALHQELYDEGLVWTEDAPVLQQKQTAGELLSVISASWYAGGLPSTFADQAGDWRVAAVPSPTDAPASAMYGGSSFGVSTNSEQAEAAVGFIEWMTTSPEAIEARLTEGGSSIFPVNEDARAAAVEAFDTSFFGDQDIYEVGAESLEAIPAGWTWGPSIATTFSTLVDESGKVKDGSASLTDIFGPAEKATIDDMEQRGLTVAE